VRANGADCKKFQHGDLVACLERPEVQIDSLEALFDLLKTGKLSVPIKAVFPLENIQEAHREWGKASGRVRLSSRFRGEITPKEFFDAWDRETEENE
jgi:hypothetical protein